MLAAEIEKPHPAVLLLIRFAGEGTLEMQGELVIGELVIGHR